MDNGFLVDTIVLETARTHEYREANLQELLQQPWGSQAIVSRGGERLKKLPPGGGDDSFTKSGEAPI